MHARARAGIGMNCVLRRRQDIARIAEDKLHSLRRLRRASSPCGSPAQCAPEGVDSGSRVMFRRREQQQELEPEPESEPELEPEPEPEPEPAADRRMEGPDPQYPVPGSVSLYELAGHDAQPPSGVSEEEFAWMEARRPLTANLKSLTVDYGAAEAQSMTEAFVAADLEHLLGALAWPGLGTRWREFLTWCRGGAGGSPAAATPQEALRGFGRALGRVVTYRALAIDAEALRRILAADCIFPSGQLRVGSDVLERVIEEKGVRTVCVARLYIAHLRRLLGHDPSISLHDDWQTTSLIASGYASYDKVDPTRSRKVHLFEISCPRVESIGWSLHEVALRADAVLGGAGSAAIGDGEEHEPWFCFSAPAWKEGVWFDGRWQRTERYGLYGVPMLSQRLTRLFVFESVDELGEAIAPFARRQADLHAADDA